MVVMSMPGHMHALRTYRPSRTRNTSAGRLARAIGAWLGDTASGSVATAGAARTCCLTARRHHGADRDHKRKTLPPARSRNGDLRGTATMSILLG
jgi:hypothetical protein